MQIAIYVKNKSKNAGGYVSRLNQGSGRVYTINPRTGRERKTPWLLRDCSMKVLRDPMNKSAVFEVEAA